MSRYVRGVIGVTAMSIVGGAVAGVGVQAYAIENTGDEISSTETTAGDVVTVDGDSTGDTDGTNSGGTSSENNVIGDGLSGEEITNSTSIINVNQNLEQVQLSPQTESSLEADIRNYLANRKPNATDTRLGVEGELSTLITDNKFSVGVGSFYTAPATTSLAGYEKFIVYLRNDGNNSDPLVIGGILPRPYASINYDKAIDKIQSAEDLSLLIRTHLGTRVGSNSDTEESVSTELNDFVTNQELSIQISGFSSEPATENVPGRLSFQLAIIQNNGENTTTMYTLPVSEVIPATETDFGRVCNEIKNNLSVIFVPNTVTAEYIENGFHSYLDYYSIMYAIGGHEINVDVSNLNITSPTTTTEGSATYLVNATDVTTGETKTFTTTSKIQKLPPNTEENTNTSVFPSVVTNIYLKLPTKTMHNNMTASELKQLVYNINSDFLHGNANLAADNVLIEIQNLNVVNATNDARGYVEFNVSLGNTLNHTDSANPYFKLAIEKTTSSSGSSSSGGSKSSSSSNSNNNTISIPKARDASNEEHKVQIVASITKNGSAATTPKEVISNGGNRLVVSSISKGNVYTGTVLTSDGVSNGSKVTIPSDAKIEAVYKYVPMLDKYIQVTEGVQVITGEVTLPTQADATYLVSTYTLSPEETVNAGWVKNADNWFLLNSAGDAKIGWQNDGVGWTYLAPETAAMKTGWLKEGSNWYHLKENGYMSTGWVKDGSKWYYLNSDGSMAYNTTVDGYKLDSSGAWIE